jgi:putative MFS transporter
MPESPRYLLSKGKAHEANAVISRLAANRLRAPADLPVTPYVTVPEGISLPAERVRLTEIFSPALARRTLIIWVVSAMTFGAQVTITVFMPTVLVSRGFTIGSSLLYTTIIDIGGLIGAILASAFGYRFKRRSVLGYGSLVAILVAIGFGVSSSAALILIFGALLQLMFILLNTTTWVWSPELYPTRVRAFGTGAAVTVALIAAAVMPLIAGAIFDASGTVVMFILIAVMYAVMAVATYLGPETHGAVLDEEEPRPEADGQLSS